METHVHKYTHATQTHTYTRSDTQNTRAFMHACTHALAHTRVYTRMQVHTHTLSAHRHCGPPRTTHRTPQQEEEGDADGRPEVRGWGGDVPLRKWPLGGGGVGGAGWTAPQTQAPSGLGQAPEGPEERWPQTSAGLQG